MNEHNDLLISFYGDDFTGSTDALEFLTRAGARAMLFIDPPTSEELDRYGRLQAIGVAGKTRSLAPDAIEAELRPALAALRSLGAPHVHYKVCSTFDSSPTIGSIGRAIDVASELFDSPFVPLVVGAPALGRYCLFGNLFARTGIGTDGQVHRLDRHPAMRCHPTTPADESDLRVHLARQTSKSIGLFDVLQYAHPPATRRATLDRLLADGAEIVLFDVLEPEHLEAIGTMIDTYASSARPVFSVGSSGVETALAASWKAQHCLQSAKRWAPVAPAEPVLIASGSCSPITQAQICTALENGFAEVALDTVAVALAETIHDQNAVARRAADQVVRNLRERRSVVVHTSLGSTDPRIDATNDALSQRNKRRDKEKVLTAQLIGTTLGMVLRHAAAQVDLQRVCIAGGDTSSYAARALEIEALEVLAPLVPGAPICRARAPGSPVDGLEVNFKGGQVGGPNYLLTLARGTS